MCNFFVQQVVSLSVSALVFKHHNRLHTEQCNKNKTRTSVLIAPAVLTWTFTRTGQYKANRDSKMISRKIGRLKLLIIIYNILFNSSVVSWNEWWKLRSWQNKQTRCYCMRKTLFEFRRAIAILWQKNKHSIHMPTAETLLLGYERM